MTAAGVPGNGAQELKVRPDLLDELLVFRLVSLMLLKRVLREV